MNGPWDPKYGFTILGTAFAQLFRESAPKIIFFPIVAATIFPQKTLNNSSLFHVFSRQVNALLPPSYKKRRKSKEVSGKRPTIPSTIKQDKKRASSSSSSLCQKQHLRLVTDAIRAGPTTQTEEEEERP